MPITAESPRREVAHGDVPLNAKFVVFLDVDFYPKTYIRRGLNFSVTVLC